MIKRNIAVIPARSGSKGLKDKNIKLLNGKPLIYYSIQAALDSNIYDVIHVSTDSSKYAEIAREYGADVPFLRNSSTSTDLASTWDAMRYVLNEYEKLGKQFDTLTVLQPTSPLRTSEDIIGAYNYFIEKDANMISTVCETEHSPLWCNTLPADYSMQNFEDETIAHTPRQLLPTYYRENGAIYILKIEHLFHTTNLYHDKCFAYILNQLHSIDIDTELDFHIAEYLLKKNLS